MKTPKAVVLLSGGLDSATVLALAKEAGFAPYALSFRYGQRHQAELQAASAVARVAEVKEHRIVDIDLGQFGGSALTTDSEVPADRDLGSNEIPVTYVPARNTVFLSLALAWAEVLGAADLFIGVNALDYSGYPDCRPEYIEAFQTMANLATRAGVEGRAVTIHAPLQHWTKAQIIAEGTRLGVDYQLTTSCYDPTILDSQEVVSCGRCDACQLRLRGFSECGQEDLIAYA